MKSFILTLLVAGALTASGTAVASDWKFDKSHSNVNFKVSHLVISRVTGTFGDFDVTFSTSDETFNDASITAVIRTASINTGNEKRDGHLRSDDFLNAELYPEIRFVSKSIEKTADGRFNIVGDLTIRDVTRQVVLDTRYNGMVKDPWGGTRAGFEASTTIDRYEYGVKWDKATEAGNLVAGKEIDIILHLEFTVKQQS